MRRPVLLAFAALAVASGCTAHVRPQPRLQLDAPPLPLKAALVIPPQLTERTDQVGQLDNVGSSFVFETGQSVPQALEEAAKKIFSSVTVVDNKRKASGVDIVLVPSSTALKHASNKSNDYTMRFELHAVATKPDTGEDVLDERYEESAQGTAASVETAVAKPAESAMAQALAKLSADLHSKLGPAPVAAAGSGPDFSTYPAGPPAPGGDLPAAPLPPPATAASPVAGGLSAKLPPPSSGSTGAGFLMGAGVMLFAAGYAAPPALLYGLERPGDHTMSFIPLAGPLLELYMNPFNAGDPSALPLAIAATAAQGLGLVLAVVGLASRGGGPSSTSSSARAERSVFHGDSWALVPTSTPHGGVGVSLISY